VYVFKHKVYLEEQRRETFKTWSAKFTLEKIFRTSTVFEISGFEIYCKFISIGPKSPPIYDSRTTCFSHK